MQLQVGQRPVRLPPHQCVSDDVRRAVSRINPPFVVHHQGGGSDNQPLSFSVRRRVFFTAEDVRIECENDGELGLACKMVAEDHNRWQKCDDQNRSCVEETEQMETAARERLTVAESSDEGENAMSEEDISIEEWGQMGYKWFKREDVAYI
jgi:hypothetical protein